MSKPIEKGMPRDSNTRPKPKGMPRDTNTR